MLEKYSGEWTETQLSQLLRRALYGIKREDLEKFKGKSMTEVVDALLVEPIEVPPPVYYDTDDIYVPYGETFIRAPFNEDKEINRMIMIKSWLINNMKNQQGVCERMVLFWHNHFSTQFDVVKDARYAFHYFEIIRNNSLGNFKKLLKEITLSPQMLVFLNGNDNNKASPNENYGRELQELFTVGLGNDSHFTESDVKNAAKILTGWKDDKVSINAFFDPKNHDSGDKAFSSFYKNKTILGKSGLDGAKETDELLDMICAQKETARHITRKLYRWFVDDWIDEKIEKSTIIPLSEVMLSENYEIKPVLKSLFESNIFYQKEFIGSIIKSPVDLIVELIRTFYISNKFESNKEWKLMAILDVFFGTAMGQEVGNPPSVAGWPAYYEYPFYYKDWVTSNKIFERNKLISFLTSDPNPNDVEENIRFDMISILNDYDEIENSKRLVKEITKRNFCVNLSDDYIVLGSSLLEAKWGLNYDWKTLINNFNKEKTNFTFEDEITKRMNSLLDFFLKLPDYQIR